jgi:mRNA interferase MazF
MQADEFIGLSTVIVAPTSQSAAAASFRPVVNIDGATTRVMVEQMRAVDLQRLERHAGHLSLEEQTSVDEALELILGL